MSKYTYGWKRPLPGVAYPAANTGGLPVYTEVDPRAEMQPVDNQLKLGACTANATGASFRYDTIVDGKDCGELSRLWIYYFERAIEHTLSQGDCGATGHDAYKVAKHGIPAEALWPYDIAKFEEKPPSAEPRAYTLTKTVRALPQIETSIKQALSNQQTIAFGFTVYESFEGEWEQPGVMPIPKKGESVLGGHEVLIVGYLEAHPGYVLVRNSWGDEWGLGGYFLFPLKVLLNPSTCSDFRTIVRPA